LKKVIILYRVVQEWRAPIFEQLQNQNIYKLEIWHGPDFKGTKVVSSSKDWSFITRKLVSFRLSLNSKNGKILFPVSPFIFFKLIWQNPDVVITEGASNLFNSIMAFIYCKLFRKKYIWWSLGKLQNRDYDNKRKKIDLFIKLIEKNSDRILTYSSIGKAYFKSLGVEDQKIVKAVNVVDTNSVFKKIGYNFSIDPAIGNLKKKYNFIILFVGALIKEKNISVLLEAMSSIERIHPDAGMIIIGDGKYANNLKEQSHSLGLKNIDFLGKRIDDVHNFFQIADVFILPGLGGLAISEAMCHSLPIICSIGDGCEIDLVTEKNGFIEKKLTPEKIVKLIDFFISNPEIRKRFGENSKKIIKDQYNIDNYINMIRHAIDF
jgi:glycosyltransferase involved in cell wall biosynthesis